MLNYLKPSALSLRPWLKVLNYLKPFDIFFRPWLKVLNYLKTSALSLRPWQKVLNYLKPSAPLLYTVVGPGWKCFITCILEALVVNAVTWSPSLYFWGHGCECVYLKPSAVFLRPQHWNAFSASNFVSLEEPVQACSKRSIYCNYTSLRQHISLQKTNPQKKFKIQM